MERKRIKVAVNNNIVNNEDCVSPSVIEKLKKKGFEHNCVTTLYALQKWFRQKHNIHIGVDYDRAKSGWFYSYYTIGNIIELDVISDNEYETFEEALNAGMLDLLNVI